MDCPLCQVAADPTDWVIADDGAFLLLPDRESLCFGHCILFPREHVAHVYDLAEPQHSALFRTARETALRLQSGLGDRPVSYVSFGAGLPHAHLHLVPTDDVDVLLHPTVYVKRLSNEDLSAAARELRKVLGDRLPDLCSPA